jgi:FkbM family methyltransferase
MRVRDNIARALPFLGPYKRLAVAALDRVRPRETYAQHGEDLKALELLRGFDLSGGRYVDVGANHPHDISNTCLLYRHGMRGIVIEPNPELAALFSRFRPRDIALAVGCSEEPGVATFSISKTPVLSSLHAENAGPIWKTIHVPLLPLDAIVRSFEPAWIPFLSVDVEGHAAAVLRGAGQTLARTYVACVEANGVTEEAAVKDLLEKANFEIVERVGCNMFAVNRAVDSFREFKIR